MNEERNADIVVAKSIAKAIADRWTDEEWERLPETDKVELTRVARIAIDAYDKILLGDFDVALANALAAGDASEEERREERVARMLADFIKYDWDGLRESAPGYPLWARIGNYQGGKQGLRELARAIISGLR